MTLRMADELIDRVRAAASIQGRSMNNYVAAVLGAATDPDLGGDEAAGIRERLARAGLLAAPVVSRSRPSAEGVAAARAAAGGGTHLSELVGRGRD